ncbi:germinal-center associated nuclear protein-like [Mya arenaria]|uniref:germinal-center associated nuclear protein-like n=1 Tax=Mya arenaria TaxID=6604 RepID=UPI0022E22A39|nr:germinal-center associated nuclear protein-like [Mya arenaria]
MSNPFGSSSSNNQNVFGTVSSPVFGQQQQVGSFAAPSSTFGQIASSSSLGQTTSSTVYGQTSSTNVFGQISNPSLGQSSSSSSMFGQAASSTNVTQSNTSLSQMPSSASVLGQTTTNMFGRTPSSSSTFGSIGMTTQSNPFGQDPVGGSNTFGGNFAATTASTNVFGGNERNAISALRQSSGSNMFARNVSNGSNLESAPPSEGSSASNAFGQTSLSSASNLLSHPFSTAAGSSNDGVSFSSGASNVFQQNLFSKPVRVSAVFGGTPSQSSSVTSSNNPFSSGTRENKSSEQETSLSSASNASTGMFGKPASSHGKSGPFGGNANPSSSLFGGSKSDTAVTSQASSAGFSKQEQNNPFASKSDTGLFGKGTNDAKDTNSSRILFGKRKVIGESTRSFGTFQEEETGQRVEGKKDEQPVGVFTGSKNKGGNVFGKSSGFGAQGQSQSSAERQGLFGKASNDVKVGSKHHEERDYNESASERDEEEARPGASRGLFGKTGTLESSTSGAGAKIQRLRQPSIDGKGASPGSKTPMRRQISEDTSTRTAIVCRNVPPKFNSRVTIKTHFKKFGEVLHVFPNPSKLQAIVHFKTHDAASEAKRKGRILGRGVPPLTIFWSNYERSPRVSDSEDRTGRKRRSEEGAAPIPKRGPKWQQGENVQEELEGMAGTSDIGRFSGGQDAGSRPEGGARRPDKPRSSSPATTVASASDVKTVSVSMFEGVGAWNTTGRVQLLELRDKYIRQNKGKRQTDLQTAKAFVGTCPDMCPEKERYDREDKRCLSVFEIIPGTENIPGKNPQVDHSKAVKEFVRSSPDQDEPLPQDLRPIPVLESTMIYLLSEIANHGQDGRWGDWFDFLWNRTRGVRKDIIQQQLNDAHAASLIEKCARFHIYCSERLCEEDMHSFDAKINNENLTKCLQTLKEFYADLETKQNYHCENEAEFRAYTVLMNLNEGDTLREVQNLRSEIRTSVSVKFALQAFFALNNNNYIKFFRLVKKASYGNACILHRYFTQVRNKALTLMMRGFSMGSKSAQVPFHDLIRMLAFEDEDEAATFCQHYGFQVTGTDVILDRSEYIDPESAWPPRRSRLIELKCTVTPGEFMNGGPFGSVLHLQPTSSFDDSGRFHSRVDLPKKGHETHPKQPVASEAPRSVEPVAKEIPQQLHQHHQQQQQQQQEPVEDVRPLLKRVPPEFIKDCAKVLFWEVIDEMVRGIGEDSMVDVNNRLHIAEDICATTTDTVVSEEVKALSEDVLGEAEDELRKALQKQLQERKDRVAVMLADDVIYDLVDQEVLNLATIEIRDVKAQLRKESIERVTVDISQQMVAQVVSDMIEEVAEDVFESDVRQRIKQLAEFEELIKLSRAGRFLQRWKKEYKAVTKLKRAMEEFPCAPNMQGYSEQVRGLIAVDDPKVANRQFYVNQKAKLTINSAVEIEKQREQAMTQVLVHSLYRRLLQNNAWQPLDLPRIVGKILARKTPFKPGDRKSRSIFWKLLLCCPDVETSTTSSSVDMATKHLCKWLISKCSKGMPPADHSSIKGNVISLYRRSLNLGKDNRSVGICVRTLYGQLDKDDVSVLEEDRSLLGTSAAMFVLPAFNKRDKDDSTYWREQRDRIQSILAVKPKGQFPLLVVLTAAANQKLSCNEVSQLLSLDDSFDVEIFLLETHEELPEQIDVVDPSVSEKLCVHLQWLAEKCQPPPELEVTYLRDFLEKALLKFYYTPVQNNAKQRKVLGYLEQDPNSLLELYNYVVQYLCEIVTFAELYDVSWPVSEFAQGREAALPASHWNKEDHFEYVHGQIASLALHPFFPLDELSEEWCDLKKDIWAYVNNIAGSDVCGARIKLCSRLEGLLHKVEEDFEMTCYLLEGEEQCQPTYANVPWGHVVSLFIDYKLDTMDFRDPDVLSDQMDKELKVVYIKKVLEEFFDPPLDWKYQEAEKVVLETQTVDDSILCAVEKVKQKHRESRTKVEIVVVEDHNRVSSTVLEAKDKASLILSSIRSERRKSDHFQKYLEKALNDGGDVAKQTYGLDEPSAFVNKDQTLQERDFTMGGMDGAFDATGYFNRSENDLSTMFDDVYERNDIPMPKRRKSDFGPQDLSGLYGKKRRERLSEIYNNDPVMMYLNEPSLVEGMASLKEEIKKERRNSDLFDKKLRDLLQPGMF